jgi:cytochrome c-type biogenesis protein CcmH
MTLWFVLALMTAAAIFAVLWPLGRDAARLRSGSDLAVYRDQLEEIERDQAAGLIGAGEAASAQVEVSRRLIAAADAEATAPPIAPDIAITRRRQSVAVMALVVLPVVAIGLYLMIGSPSRPISAQKPSIEHLVAQVEARLAQNPNEGRGWEVLAPIYLRLGRFDDAVKARRQALALNGESAERFSGLAEALIAAANGVITADALAALKSALALDAQHVKTRFYLGLAAEQDGRAQDAIAIWRALLDEAPADAPWAPTVRGELARLTGGAKSPSAANPSGPSEDQIAAAGNLSPEQRIAMVKGMVERLAERLDKDGSDIDGWLRLLRSYMVLGQRDRAIAAAGQARRAFTGDPDKLKRIDELVKGLGLDG